MADVYFHKDNSIGQFEPHVFESIVLPQGQLNSPFGDKLKVHVY